MLLLLLLPLSASGQYGGGNAVGYGSGSNPSLPFIGGLGDPELERCFTLTPNCVLVHASPFERRILDRFSVDACARFCLGYVDASQALGSPYGANGLRFRCEAAVFDRRRRICDLYAVTVAQRPATHLPLAGFDYVEVKPGCTTAASLSGGVSLAPPVPNTTPRPAPPASVRPPAPRDEGTFCPRGQLPLFQRLEGWEVAGLDDAVIPDFSERQCLDLCLQDRDLNGDRLECHSFEFDGVSGECRLSRSTAAPTRSGVLVPAPDQTTYEKSCARDEEVERECPNGVLHRRPGDALVGFEDETASLEVNNLAECVQACIELGRTICVSANYFDDRLGEPNCVLSTESAETRPGAVAAVEEPAEYFDLGLCEGALPAPLASLGRSRRSRALTRLRNLKLRRRVLKETRLVPVAARIRHKPNTRIQRGRELVLSRQRKARQYARDFNAQYKSLHNKRARDGILKRSERFQLAATTTTTTTTTTPRPARPRQWERLGSRSQRQNYRATLLQRLGFGRRRSSRRHVSFPRGR